MAAERDVLITVKVKTEMAGQSPADKMAAEWAKARAALNKEFAEMTDTVDDFHANLKEGSEKYVGAWAKTYQSAADQLQASNDRAKKSQVEMLNHTKELGEGLLKVGRGFATIGLLGEDNLKKVLEVFLKFQAAIDILDGGFKLLKGWIDLWEKYKIAVEAAASAQRALAVMQAGGAAGSFAQDAAANAAGSAIGGRLASGGGRTGGDFAGDAAANATGNVAVGIGSRLLSGVGTIVSGVVGMLGPVGAAVAAAGTVIVGVAYAFPKLTQGVMESLGMIEKEADIKQRAIAVTEAMVAKQEELNKARDAEIAALKQSREMAMSKAALQDEVAGGGVRNRDFANKMAMGNLRGRIAGAEGNTDLSFDKMGAIQAYRGELIEALKEAESIERERLKLTMQEGKEKIAAAQKYTQELEKQRDKLLDQSKEFEKQAQTIEGRIKSAAEKFGDMSPAEQAQLLAAKNKLDKGETLNKDERDKLLGLGLDTVSDPIKKQLRQSADAAGFYQRFTDSEQALADAERTKAAEAKAAAAKVEVDIKTNHEIEVKLGEDYKALAEQIANKVFEILGDERRLVSEKLEEERRREAGNAALRKTNEEGPATG